MKAKITWFICLLLAVGLAGAAKNFCGKSCRQGFAAVRETTGAAACTAGARTVTVSLATADDEIGMESPGLSPVTLFIFQLK